MKYSSQENKIQFPDLIGKASDVQIIKAPDGTETVSYTHLDVYKRQVLDLVNALL